jgi:O-antigen/teichoic acid export membrane protein
MRARQLVRVSAGVWAVTIWQAILGLITTPFLVHHLGPAQYGIFALIGIIATYLSNLEIGFGQATLRFVARARAAGDADDEANVLTTSLAVFAVAGTTAALIAFLGSSFISDHFVHGPARGQVAVDAIRLGAIMLLGSLLASFASVSLQALNHFAAVIRTRAIFGTAASAGAVITVAVGGGLRDVLLVQLAINAVLAATLLVLLARSTAASLVPRLHRQTFMTMAKYGVSVLVAGLGFQVLLQGPPTVLAGYSTTDQVAAYAVPAMIMQQIVILMGSASFAFAPFASAESASSDRTRLTEIFRSNVRVTLLLAGPVAAYLVLLGKPLLTAWIGAAFASHAAGPLRFLAVAALILALSAPPADVLRGLGRPGWVAGYTITAGGLTLAGSFALVQSHGAGGVAASLAAGLTIGTAVLLVVVAERMLGIRPADLARALGGPALAASSAVAMFALGALLTSGFAGALITGLVGACLYAGLVLRWVLDDRERDVLSALRPQWRKPAGDVA